MIYRNVTINASQTVSFGTSGTSIAHVEATATSAPTRIEIMVHLPEQAILHKGKPAKHDATKKWAHALESKFPELTNKSDAELSATIRHMRER